jgi:alanine dehydrogenase
LRFRGGARVAMIARRSSRAGRLAVQIADRRRTVSLRGPRGARRVVFRSGLLRPVRHRVRITALGGGVVDLDAIAIEQGLPAPR